MSDTDAIVVTVGNSVERYKTAIVIPILLIIALVVISAVIAISIEETSNV